MTGALSKALFFCWLFSVACGEAETTSPTPDDSETERDAGPGADSETGTGNALDSAADSDTGTGPAFENLGVCGVSVEATVTANSFEGFEEHYLIGDEGLGEDRCRVRYELHAVGAPEVPCDLCTWAFSIEKRSPTVVADVDETCGASEIGLDADAIVDMDGIIVEYGLETDYFSHDISLLRRFNPDTNYWEPFEQASWDETSGEFAYNRREGFCGY